MATLGIQSGSFDHEHVNYFHPGSMSSLLEANRFEMVELTTPGQLDADLVRKRALSGELDLAGNAFLREVLLERWADLGDPFQSFLASNRLSSHMWAVARRR